ncbi:MAG: DHH family phosphoesterase [Candidatus Hepatoplasma vulgare]|nr:MAG: DHH family phosphoesterase [Candidatus Hepatoplasma sp.]
MKSFFSLFPDVIDSFHFNLNSGYIIYDERNRIVFISKWLYENGFKIFLGKNINLFYSQRKFFDNDDTIFHFKNSTYLVKKYSKTNILIFKDETNLSFSNQIIKKRDLALIVIDKHFSNKVIDKAKINLNINEYLEKWSEKNSGILRTESTFDSSTLIILKWNKINTEIIQKNLMNKLIEILGNNVQNASISIGIAHGNLELGDLFNNAKEATEHAKSRGGNQVVISDEKNRLLVVGESTVKDQDNSKVELKFFNDNFTNQLIHLNRIFITAHINADIDALAASVGLARFVKEYNKNVSIILDEFDGSSSKIFNNISQHTKSLFIKIDDFKEKVNKKIGIIILDTSDDSRVQAFDLLESVEVENRFIIDHHRIGISKIKTIKENEYIDTASSSTSELITELFLLKEVEGKDYKHLSKEEASLLILGIYLDTNNLKRNTSPRTFESLTYLTNEGGEINNLINYTKSDFLNTPLIVSALENIDKITSEIVYTYIPEMQIVDESTLSFLANMLLDYEGIKASFILAKINKNTYKMSARSIDKINVQNICEKLGGGGHFNVAAVTFNKDDMKFKNLRKKIRDTIIESVAL